MGLLDRALAMRQPIQQAAVPPPPSPKPAPRRHDIRDLSTGRYTVAKHIRVRKGQVLD